MATSMLGLLGVLIFIWGTNAASNLPDFTVNKMGGKWYLSGTATGPGWIDDPKWVEKVSVLIVSPTAGRDMQVKNSLMRTDGTTELGCIRVYNTLVKTRTVGKFYFNSMYYQPLTEVSVVDVQYDDYIIVQKKRTMNQNVTFNLELYTRNPVVSLEVKNKFSQIALKQRFAPEKTIFFPYKDECV